MADEQVPVGKDGRPLREGYTTGACAAAAAKAAAIALETGLPPASVEIGLPVPPSGRRVTFPLHTCAVRDGLAEASVIKDAGDDPDATHKAEIGARVRRRDAPGVEIDGAEGVGRVTRPGLGLAVGEAAINPVPRRMIEESVREAIPDVDVRGVRVEVFVPRGAEIVKRTLNERLGIVGGISILGTTGIVKPYSTAAFKASIEQAIDVALAAGERTIVLTTGGKSERFAMKIHADLPEVAFVQMGDFYAHALEHCARRGARAVRIVGMIGKVSKQAMGLKVTHAARGEVDLDFLADCAVAAGAAPDVAAEIRAANTARHAGEIAEARGVAGFYDEVCRRACAVAAAFTGGSIEIEYVITDFDEGKVLGRAALPRTAGTA